ncbi:MAG: FG-GAP repeat domain-containing protein [Candidatus Methylomirabilia bacterium]
MGAPSRGSTLTRVPPGRIDREGFRAIYEGERVVRRERDLDDDGRPDVIVHYGADGQPVRREESSQLDGRIDTWTFYADGKAERKEADTDGDGRVDLWAFYGPEGELVRVKSLTAPRRSLMQFYEEGKVVREERRREPGGQLQARQTYQDGKIQEKEEDSSGSGQLDLVSIFDAEGQLVKQGHRDGDGRMVAWRYFDPERGTLLREEEIGERGEVVAVSYYQSGKLARRELYELKDELFKRVPLLSERESRRGG